MTDIVMGIATVIALVLGPVIAVYLTRYIDDRRADKARKLDIFRTLMKTRGIRLHWDHVGALNLVEVEFIKHPRVVDAWKEYMTSLRSEAPPVEQKERFDKFVKKRESLLTILIDEIAKVLKIEVKQLDTLEGNYVPQGWDDEEWEQRLLRRRFIDVLYGKAAIPIQPHQPSKHDEQSPYPSPPNSE